MATTAAAVARALADRGIDRAFGLPGGEVLVLIDELRKAGIDFVLMRHEANAGIAAAVYGKLKRQPGVVIATLGPGAANLLLPVASAYLDQEPLLAITRADSRRLSTQPHPPVAAAARHLPADVQGGREGHVHECRRHHPARARFVHGASLRRVVRDAVGARSGQAGDAGHAVSPNGHGHDTVIHRADARAAALALEAKLVESGAPARAGRPERRSGASRRACASGSTRWNLPVAVTPKVKGIVDETGAELRRRHQRHGRRRPDGRRAEGVPIC